MENNELNEKTQIKRKYAEHNAIHVMEKAPVRNKVIEFVGKRYVTEDELKGFVNGLNETNAEGKKVDSKWISRNSRYFESVSNRGQKVITLSKYGQRVLEKIVRAESQKQSASTVNEGRSQIKRKYGEYTNIRVNEKAPVRNKVIEFVGKRFVTESEMEAFLTKLVEDRGKDFNNKKWFTRNERYFESFENRGQKVWTLSKYGKRVLEMIKSKPKNINESIGLFKSEIFESARTEEFLSEGALASKGHNIGVYLGEMEPENSDFQDLYDKIAETLGEDINDVIVVDSETNEDDALSAKVYNYLSTHFNGKEAVETPKFKNSNHGSFQMYDPKLNVVRLDDYGFVAFYFTTSSKF